MKNKKLKRRIIELSYKHKLSHLGSCLSAVDIINDIFEMKELTEKFILSAGHAGLALYVVMESKGYGDAEKMLEKHGIHPNRDKDFGIDCSTGSLGHGIGIACGMALAERTKKHNVTIIKGGNLKSEVHHYNNVYCLMSDGETAEASVFESLRIANDQKLTNLKIYINCNGFSAYGTVDIKGLESIVYLFKDLDIRIMDTSNIYTDFPFLKGIDAHYLVLDDKTCKEALEILK